MICRLGQSYLFRRYWLACDEDLDDEIDLLGLRPGYSRLKSFFKPGDMAEMAEDPVKSYSTYAEGLVHNELKDRQREGCPSRGCKEDQRVGSSYNIEGRIAPRPAHKHVERFLAFVAQPSF